MYRDRQTFKNFSYKYIKNKVPKCRALAPMLAGHGLAPALSSSTQSQLLGAGS